MTDHREALGIGAHILDDALQIAGGSLDADAFADRGSDGHRPLLDRHQLDIEDQRRAWRDVTARTGIAVTQI